MASPEPEVLVEPTTLLAAGPAVEEPAVEGPAVEAEAEGVITTAMMSVLTTLTSNVSKTSSMKPPFFKDPALDWPSALKVWGPAWPLHVYLAAFAYSGLTLWAGIHVVRTLIARQLPGRAYYMVLNLVIFVCCPGRAAFLLMDPYGSAKFLSRFQIRLTIAPLLPSLTAAFILVFATLLKVTKMRVVSPRVFRPRMIVLIVLLNYAVGITTDLLGGLYMDLAIMILFCETYFILWGIIASFAYFLVFYRLYIGTVVNRRKLNQIGDKNGEVNSVSGGNDSSKNEKSGSVKEGCYNNTKEELTTKLPIAVKITLMAAFCFVMISLLHVWRITNAIVYFMNGWGRANPWQWFMYKTLLRVAELLMCGTILYVGSLPFLHPGRK